MKKYAKIVNEETKACEVGLGTNSKFYQSIGMTEMDVEQAYDSSWYLQGYAPEKPEPTKEEIQTLRANAYKNEVDPLMSEYTRKKTFNLFDESEEENLLAKIEAKVAKIKEEYPYPEQKSTEIEENIEKDTEAIKEKSTIL